MIFFVVFVAIFGFIRNVRTNASCSRCHVMHRADEMVEGILRIGTKRSQKGAGEVEELGLRLTGWFVER